MIYTGQKILYITYLKKRHSHPRQFTVFRNVAIGKARIIRNVKVTWHLRNDNRDCEALLRYREVYPKHQRYLRYYNFMLLDLVRLAVLPYYCVTARCVCMCILSVWIGNFITLSLSRSIGLAHPTMITHTHTKFVRAVHL